MDIYKLILGTVIVLLVAVVTRSEVSTVVRQDPPLASYTCEGNCVPVYFEVRAAKTKLPYSQIYLSGSFNGWVHAEAGLKLEKTDNATYRAAILLPEGETLKYRYTVGRDQIYGFSEYGELRSMRVIEGHIRRDTVSEWGAALLTTHVWNPEKLEEESIQDRFLEKYFSEKSTSEPITVSQVDSMFQVAEHNWKEEGLLYYPGYDQLLSWTYSYLYHRQMKVGNHEANPVTECHMLTNYALPAFIKEVEYIEATREPLRYGLLRSYSDMDDVLGCENLSEYERALFTALFHTRIPVLMQDASPRVSPATGDNR